MGIRILGVLGLALGITACQQAVPPEVISAIPVEYTVSADEAGPITAETAYSAAAIRSLFPDAEIQTVRAADEAGVIDAISVVRNNMQLFQVVPDAAGERIRAVQGAGLAIAGPNGERIGASFASTGARRADCTAGTGAWTGMVVCTARGAPNIRLVFDAGDWDGAAGELPPQTVLAGGRLHRIVWRPLPRV